MSFGWGRGRAYEPHPLAICGLAFHSPLLFYSIPSPPPHLNLQDKGKGKGKSAAAQKGGAEGEVKGPKGEVVKKLLATAAAMAGDDVEDAKDISKRDTDEVS